MRFWFLAVPILWLIIAGSLITLELGIVSALISFIAGAILFGVLWRREHSKAGTIAFVGALLFPAILGVAIVALYVPTLPPCEGDPCTVTLRIPQQ